MNPKAAQNQKTPKKTKGTGNVFKLKWTGVASTHFSSNYAGIKAKSMIPIITQSQKPYWKTKRTGRGIKTKMGWGANYPFWPDGG